MVAAFCLLRSSYRVLVSELSSVRPVAQAHTQPVTALAFPKTRPDVVATGAQGRRHRAKQGTERSVG